LPGDLFEAISWAVARTETDERNVRLAAGRVSFQLHAEFPSKGLFEPRPTLTAGYQVGP